MAPTSFRRAAHEGSAHRFTIPDQFAKTYAARLIGGDAFLIRVRYHDGKPHKIDAAPTFDSIDIIVEVVPTSIVPDSAKDRGNWKVAYSDVSEFQAVTLPDKAGKQIRFVAKGERIEGKHQVGDIRVRYYFSPKITASYRDTDDFVMNFVQSLVVPGQ